MHERTTDRRVPTSSLRIAAVAVTLLCGCSTGPSVIPLGELESPCESNADCQSQNFCVTVDEDRFCTVVCSSSGGCPSLYECDEEAGVCYPTPGGGCRLTQARCGPSFPACCTGLRCTDLGSIGSYCIAECATDDECPSRCCHPFGDALACSPTEFCGL